jgi:hypothetical protein
VVWIVTHSKVVAEYIHIARDDWAVGINIRGDIGDKEKSSRDRARLRGKSCRRWVGRNDLCRCWQPSIKAASIDGRGLHAGARRETPPISFRFPPDRASRIPIWSSPSIRRGRAIPRPCGPVQRSARTSRPKTLVGYRESTPFGIPDGDAKNSHGRIRSPDEQGTRCRGSLEDRADASESDSPSDELSYARAARESCRGIAPST